MVQNCAIGCDMQRSPPLLDQIKRILDHSQGFQSKKVKLDQTGLFHPFHIKLGGRHIRARILINRHQRVKWSVGNHHTGSVGGGVAQQALDLLAIGQKPVHHLFVFGLFTQPRLVGQRLFNTDRFHALNRNHFRQAINLPVGHLKDPTNVAHRRLRKQRPKGNDLPNPVTTIFLLDILNYFLAAIHTKIDVKIWHRNPIRVQEPFKQQRIA